MGSLFLLWAVVLIITLGKACSQFAVSIDCGSQTSYKDDRGYWQPDEGYTKTGENKAVQLPSSPSSTQLDTLRVFAKHKRNCYTLPAEPSTVWTEKYLIRVSFYYGNYDGRSEPPSFDLEFQGMKWATVVTSNTEPQFHEMLYYATKNNITVCLVQTRQEQFPFINALELSLAYWSTYDFLEPENVSWLTSYRYRYGAGADDWILGYPDDLDNRIWEPNTPAGVKAVSVPSFTICRIGGATNSVTRHAVEALNPTDSINLLFAINGSHDLQHYVRAYFAGNINGYETRTFGFYVNDDYISTVTTKYALCTSAQGHVHSNGTLNVQLRPTGNSTSPPLISGIEIYTALSGEGTKEKKKKKKNLGLLIGLPVGLVLGLTLLGLIILLLLRSRRTRPTQGQATTTGQQQEANPQQSVSAQTPMPSQSEEIPVSSNGNGDQTSMNHGINTKDLDDQLELHHTSMSV